MWPLPAIKKLCTRRFARAGSTDRRSPMTRSHGFRNSPPRGANSGCSPPAAKCLGVRHIATGTKKRPLASLRSRLCETGLLIVGDGMCWPSFCWPRCYFAPMSRSASCRQAARRFCLNCARLPTRQSRPPIIHITAICKVMRTSRIVRSAVRPPRGLFPTSLFLNLPDEFPP